jgi:dimethylaniline monooxygenase (N-oxide forming)
LPPQTDPKRAGQQLTGAELNRYFETFADRLLKGKIVYNVEILNVWRHREGGWTVLVKNKLTGEDQSMHYDKIVVCTGARSLLS